MGLNCGIVGLPNVGKSTIFQALTAAPAEAANYPFCTIEPNVGVVPVKDERLEKISALIKPQKTIPAVVEFVDIAGLVKGASKGEGLGNQFLGHIRQVAALVHVVRCFDNDDIVHVSGKVNPEDDINTINYELALADLEAIEKREKSLDKFLKNQNKDVVKKAKMVIPLLDLLKAKLGEGKPAYSLNLSADDLDLISDLHLITLKKTLYVCNVDEEALAQDNDHVKKCKELASGHGGSVLKVCGSIESEIAALDSESEKKEFLQSVGLDHSGLDRLIVAGYELLGLKTYFTAGEKEVRAWTFKSGDKAPAAAGVIHSDFERGFIKAEVFHCDDLFELKSTAKVKEMGKLRIEGKDYEVSDGDIMHFRFNV